jgi:predicted acylesterase/phospholipase RssA
MALDFQLSLQGGGAKIVALLAAAEAVQYLEEKREICLTRIAGTSAGAIVGAFLAAGKPISSIRASLAGDKGRHLIARFPVPGMPRALWQAYRGQPFWSDEPLQEWLSGVLPGDFANLGKPLIVVSANLDQSKAEKHTGRGPLINALLESAGLPFCFRSWQSNGNSINVDGGLCENLPVEDLLADADKLGRVIGFTFPQAISGRPKDLKGFAMSLLDVAINHSVQTAHSRLGSESVFPLEVPELSTFNFNSAMRFLQSDAYDKQKEKVIGWFRQLVRSSRPPRGMQFDTDVWNRPPKDDFCRQMKAVGRIYRMQHVEKMHCREMKLVARLNSLAEEGDPGFGEPDEVLYEFAFEPAEEQIGAMALTLSSPVGSDFFGRYELKLFDSSGAELQVEAMASIPPDSTTERELVAFFTPPLKRDAGVYVLSLKDHGWDLMAGLHNPDQRTDFLEISPRRATGTIGEVILAIEVPDRIGNIRVASSSNQGAEMNNGELRKLHPPLGFRAFGWKGINLPVGSIRAVFQS